MSRRGTAQRSGARLTRRHQFTGLGAAVNVTAASLRFQLIQLIQRIQVAQVLVYDLVRFFPLAGELFDKAK